MRLLAQLLSLARVARIGRLDRGPLAVVVAVATAAMALGVAAGSSNSDAKRPSGNATRAHEGDPALVVPQTATLKRVADRHARGPRRGGAEHYRRTARKRVPPAAAREFIPLYREAERVYDVNWRLLASIHRQETAFSRAPSTYHGLNDFGCCAGPMQFNVTNGPVSTWESYRHAYRDGRRPKRYPHRTRKHPSIYDDFDAIMAAGSLLKDSGAGRPLDAGTWGAAYDYYGHDLFGITYASQVLARAEAWQRDGFCPNCALDESLVDEFDDTYGAPIREQLLAAERRRKQKEGDRDDRADRRRDRLKNIGARARARELERARARNRRKSRPPSAKRQRPSPRRPRRRRTSPAEPRPTPAAPPATPPTTTPTPPPSDCNLVNKLLGCRR